MSTKPTNGQELRGQKGNNRKVGTDRNAPVKFAFLSMKSINLFAMKKPNPLIIPATILLLGITLDSFAGAATLSNSRIESLLSAAGFQILTGADAQQQVWYSRTAPNTLERHIQNGQAVYTYTDRRGCFMYIGGQPEYQQYKRLERETSNAERRIRASEALDQPWRDWVWTWKPWKLVEWGYEP
jgi:hypothetical protein